MAMRSYGRAAALLAMVALEGCVGAPTILSKDEQKSLQAIPLFDKDASPRFSAYVACTSEDESCATVHKAFSQWTDERRIDLHLIDPDDAVFQGGAPTAKKAASKPYRVAFQLKPLVVPSFFQFRGGVHSQGGYVPPRVGYKGNVYVVDAATGAVLQTLAVHQEITARPEDPMNGYLMTEMNTLLVSVDPTYHGTPQNLSPHPMVGY
jgi:hypothetical protein